jgi:transcriptional regulator with XRE-family HTH domain
VTERDEDETLGEALKAARLRKHLSQDELAKRIGVKGARWTVKRWEDGEHVPKEANRAALARELSLPNDFFAGVPAQPGEERLSRRVAALEETVGRLERHIFGEGAARAR